MNTIIIDLGDLGAIEATHEYTSAASKPNDYFHRVIIRAKTEQKFYGVHANKEEAIEIAKKRYCEFMCRKRFSAGPTVPSVSPSGNNWTGD